MSSRAHKEEKEKAKDSLFGGLLGAAERAMKGRTKRIDDVTDSASGKKKKKNSSY